MAIQLRTNKASALTYNEMDRNFSSFFYSASVDTDTNRLYLWYTGSANLNMSQDDNYGPARSIEVELQPTTGNNPTLVVAGNPRSIQFRHATDPRLDADAGFIYNTAQQLGIGAATPNVTAKIHAVGTSNVPATLRLESLNTGTFNRRAVVDFYQGATSMGSIGRDTHNDNNLYIKTYTPSIRSSGPRGLGLGFEEIINEDPGHVRFTIGNGDRRIGGNFGAFTQVGFGIGTLLPQHALQVQGNGYITGKLGVGDVPNTAALNVFQTAQTGTSLGDFETIAKFGITPQENVDSLKILSVRQLAGGNNWWSNGMRIQQDVDGTYRTYIQFSGEGNMHGFSIGTGESSSPHTPGHPGIQERFRIDSYGNISMNKTVANAKLDVNGDTIVTGSFTATGNATIKGTATVDFSLTTGTTAAVGTDLTVGAKATILDVPLNTDSNPRILVQSQTTGQVGQVQYITGVVPKGAIMMWTASVAPPGWAICNGNGGAPIGGITIPDLRERFIVGAGIDPSKIVIDYSAPFTINSYQVAAANNTTFTIDTVNPYYLDNTGVLRQGVNIDGHRYHLYKGPGSTTATGFKYIVFDNRYSIYSLVVSGVGGLPAVGSAATGIVAFAGDFVTGTTFANGATLNGAGKPLFNQGNDQHAPYTKHFTKGRRVAYREINWQTMASPGYAVGDKGGEDDVTLLGSQIPKHQHDSTFGERDSGGTYGNSREVNDGLGSNGGLDGDNRRFLTSAQGNSQPHENRPPYYALTFIIYTGVV